MDERVPETTHTAAAEVAVLAVPAEAATADDPGWVIEPADAAAADETVWFEDLLDDDVDHPAGNDASTAARFAEEVRRRWARRRTRMSSN